MTVLELLEKPEAWTQGAPARNSEGWSVNTDSEKATCWCLLGAIWRVYPADAFDMELKLRAIVGKSIAVFNDEKCRTHAEVLEAVRKAGI